MVHPTAQVDPRAVIGKDVRIWNWVQVREGAEIGDGTILSKSVCIDCEVRIGRNVKVQNNVSIYHGATIEDGVFIGPHVCFTNDRFPRAINPDGTRKGVADWEVSSTIVRYGASIGANATILPGITIGRFAMIGAGTVVTRNVPDHGLVMGSPGRLAGYVCTCGRRMEQIGGARFRCAVCLNDLETRGTLQR